MAVGCILKGPPFTLHEIDLTIIDCNNDIPALFEVMDTLDKRLNLKSMVSGSKPWQASSSEVIVDFSAASGDAEGDEGVDGAFAEPHYSFAPEGTDNPKNISWLDQVVIKKIGS